MSNELTLLRISQACRQFNICRNTLRKWRKEGYVREVRLGRIVLIDPAPMNEQGITEKLKSLDLERRVRE